MPTLNPFTSQNSPEQQDSLQDTTQAKKKKALNIHKEVVAIIKSLGYYRDPVGKYYAKIENKDVSEIISIEDERFTSALSRIIFEKHEIPFDQKGVRFCIGISRQDIEQKAQDASFINRIT